MRSAAAPSPPRSRASPMNAASHWRRDAEPAPAFGVAAADPAHRAAPRQDAPPGHRRVAAVGGRDPPRLRAGDGLFGFDRDARLAALRPARQQPLPAAPPAGDLYRLGGCRVRFLLARSALAAAFALTVPQSLPL